MTSKYIILSVLVTSLVTYIIRMVPLVFFRRKIKTRWLRSFLYYVPYSVLAAMTFPAVFTSTGSLLGGICGSCAALILAYMKKGLLTASIGAALVAFLVQLI